MPMLRAQTPHHTKVILACNSSEEKCVNYLRLCIFPLWGNKNQKKPPMSCRLKYCIFFFFNFLLNLFFSLFFFFFKKKLKKGCKFWADAALIRLCYWSTNPCPPTSESHCYAIVVYSRSSWFSVVHMEIFFF